MTIQQTKMGEMELFRLENKNGIAVEIINLGGIVTSIKTPDREGEFEDIVLGFDKLSSYQTSHPYFGAIIGRYANRIAKGIFSIDATVYHLAKNNGENALHGGIKGFDKVFWEATTIEEQDGVGVVLSRTSPDTEEGYPGNLVVKVTYLLNNANELVINYEATTDKPTLCNLTNHSYFNLKGAGNGDVLEHEVLINASQYTPVDATFIPTGINSVAATPFDFRKPMTVGARIGMDNEQLRLGNGYDHNFVLDRVGKGLEVVASVYEPKTGRTLEVLTTEPGVQLYTGNGFDGTIIGKGNKSYEKYAGLCLETQHFPDSPNQAVFPSTILRPKEEYKTSTIYRFGVRFEPYKAYKDI